MVQKICKNCKKIFNTYPSRLKVGKGTFCSVGCHNISQKGKLPWNTGKKSLKLSASKTGSKNPNWKGGVSKKEGDKKYSQTPKGREAHRKAGLKYNRKEENRVKSRAWVRNRLKTNVHFKIKRNISNGIWCKLVRYRGAKKDRKVLECLPYTIDELKVHLEKLFVNEMSWSNYGKWHIDHIVPDSSFYYMSTKDPGFQDSWSLKNLQPLWGIDNIRKSRKLLTQ